MKILIATSLGYPRVGGVSTYISRLMQELRQRGHTADLIAHTPGLDEIYLQGGQRIAKALIRKQIEPAIERYFLRNWPEASRWIRWREAEHRTFETAVGRFKLADYDVIHAQDAMAARALIRVKPAATPLVVTYHNMKSREWQVSDPSKHPMEMEYIRREDALGAKGAHVVIFPCRWLYDNFRALQIPKPKLHIIPYGTRVSTPPSTVPQQNSAPVIACPARLVPIKGHAYLFEALRRLKDRGHTFQCWVIGDGILKTQLMSLGQSLGLEPVIEFLGARNDVDRLLAQSDLVVLPTLHDTFPFAVIEAQLAGKPVVASRVGGIPEMIETAIDGWLVEPGNSEALADILGHLLETPSERTTIGRRARQRALTRWSLPRMVSETIRAYHQALASRDLPPGLDFDLMGSLPEKWNLHGHSPSLIGHVSGRIIDGVPHALGSPMIIHLLDASGVSLQSTSASKLGEFRFTDLPVGKYGLLVKISCHDSPCFSYVEVREGEVYTEIHLGSSRRR